MKLDVYQEQYKSEQAYHNPKDIGFGYDINKFRDLGNSLINATQNKLAQDDEFNSARIEADTVFAADKMYRDYLATADPDNFEKDMATQQANIQNLIQQQSQKFKLPKYQNAFKEKMTRGLEEQYMGQTLKYSYGLQEVRYKELGQSAIDSYKAQLLAGNTFLTIPDVMESMRDYYTTLAKRYHIPQTMLDAEIKSQNTSIVKSYAYGMVDKNPEAVRDILVGNSFDKYRAYKESIGEGFTIDQFWQNDDLRKEYAESEFGAKYVDVVQYLDYDTRMDLWRLAEGEISKREKEALKQKLLKNSMSDWELDQQRDSAIAYAKEKGSLPQNLLGVSEVTASDDEALGSVNQHISMGEIKKGSIAKGNKITKEGETFAKGLSGRVTQLGYTTYVTSNLRPGDHDSKHKDGSAIDIQAFVIDKKTGKQVLSEQGLIEEYKAAVALYKNEMRKGGTLFEVNPARLDYIKNQLEAEGVDTSYINWSQSKQYGAAAYKEGRQHIHFGINPKADYTTTNSGAGLTYKFKTQQGKPRYLQQRADGKSPQEAYDAARQDEFEMLAAVQERALIQNIVGVKNADGTLLDPAYYGRALENQRQAVLNNKKLSNTDRLIQLKAIDNAKSEIPKLQQMFREDTSSFMMTTNQASTPEQAAVLQAKRYGIASEDIMMLTNEEAKTKADQLYAKLPPDQAVNYLKSNAVNPATLRQIAKFMPDDSKSDMLMYSAMASPAMTSNIIEACKNWDDVKKAINQDKKMFPSMWEEKTIGAFKNNPIIKGYFADISKTNPQEATKMLSAMKAIYAYRMYAGATDSKAVINDIAKNLIANNYSTVTIATPRFGKTSINVATSFNGNDLYKIQRVSSLISKIGPNRDSIFVPNNLPATSSGLAGRTATEQAKLTQNHWLDSITKTAKLSGTPDGLNAVFTWEDARGILAGANILSKANRQALKVSYKDMVALYNEAYKLKETWKVKGTNSYRVPTGKYYSYYGTTETRAMDAALEHVLTNRYNWLNKTDYTNFKK